YRELRAFPAMSACIRVSARMGVMCRVTDSALLRKLHCPLIGMCARSVLLASGSDVADGIPDDGTLLHRRYGERITCATPGGTAVTSQMLDVSVHERRRERRMQDPEYRAAYERAAREIAQTDAVIRQLDALRVDL